MRAVIFVSTACQPEKPALMTQAGAWVFQAFEVWERLGRRLPDLMVAPVGDGPTLVALDKGFAELVSCGLAARQPRLIGVQAERCQPLTRAWLGAPPGRGRGAARRGRAGIGGRPLTVTRRSAVAPRTAPGRPRAQG
jgi:threonine synthase